MSQNLAHLCALLIEDIYGPFLSKMFSILTECGRLSANQIAQKCRLPLRQAFSGLALLVQQQLVYHHTALGGKAIYEANKKSAYDLLRTGRFLHNARQKFESQSLRLIKRLLIIGPTNTTQLEDYLHISQDILRSSSKDRVTSNGTAVGSEASPRTRVEKILKRLVDNHFVVSVREAHYQSHLDARTDAEAYVRSQEPSTILKGKKAQLALDAKVDFEMVRRVDNRILQADNVGSSKSNKRMADEDEHLQSLKRIKHVNGDATESSAHRRRMIEGDDIFPSHHIISGNCRQTVLALRNERLVSHIYQQRGRTAAQVFGAALEQCIGTTDFKPAAEALPGSSIDRVIDLDKLLLDANARDYLVYTSIPQYSSVLNNSRQLASSGSSALATSHTNGYTNGVSDHDNQNAIPLEVVESQLRLLAEAPSPLVRRGLSVGQWMIDLEAARVYLRDAEVNKLIRSRFGPMAMRIVRILADKGKTDERWLQEIGLLSARDLRQTLATLKSHGFVDLQEVPREPQRQPNRTIFLWFYDAKRTVSCLLEDAYKAMAKLLQRMSLERRSIRSTLEKVERSDVKGNEDTLLAPEEMKVLKQWRKREQWMWVEMDRLDTSVAMLRDV